MVGGMHPDSTGTESKLLGSSMFQTEFNGLVKSSHLTLCIWTEWVRFMKKWYAPALDNTYNSSKSFRKKINDYCLKVLLKIL